VWIDPDWATRQRSGDAQRQAFANESISDPTL